MNTQRGFTLIELVMVIVILGILAATALPKFANLQTSAESASVAGARGAVASAMAIAHAQSLIENEGALATSDVVLEGVTVNMVFGYPAATDIDNAAGLSDDDFDFAVAAGVATIDADGLNTCSFTYTQATAANAPAVVSPVSGGGGSC